VTAGSPYRTGATGPATAETDDLAGLGHALRAEALERVTVTLPHAPWQVEIQGYRRRETVWTGDLPAGFGTVPNKVPYLLDGAPHYPELLLVRLLEGAGWSAAWRKTWNGVEFWRDLREPMELPDTITAALDQITLHAGHAGQWEVVAWRARQLRLLTSRPSGGQLVTAYQADWLSVAMRMGLPIGCFAVVERRVQRPPRRRRLEHIQPS
jgi:hypothetical protein